MLFFSSVIPSVKKMLAKIKRISFWAINLCLLANNSYASSICENQTERESSVVEIACLMSVDLNINMDAAMTSSFLKHWEIDKELCNFFATSKYDLIVEKSLNNTDILRGHLWFESEIGSNKEILDNYSGKSKSSYCEEKYKVYGPGSEFSFFIKDERILDNFIIRYVIIFLTSYFASFVLMFYLSYGGQRDKGWIKHLFGISKISLYMSILLFVTNIFGCSDDVTRRG